MPSWQESLHLLHRPLQSHSPKTDFPPLSPWTSGKSVKGVLCSLCLRTNTQLSSHTTDEHNTGSWSFLAWQGSFILLGAQQTTPKVSAAPNNPNHKGYKIRFPDFWLAQIWKVCGVPCTFDEAEFSVAMGDLDWLRARVGHGNVEKRWETAATFECFLTFGSSFLLHVPHTLILEVVHMVFFLFSENSQWDDVQHSWDCGICAAALNTSNRRASTDSGAEQIWKLLFQNDCRDDSTFAYTIAFHSTLCICVCVYERACMQVYLWVQVRMCTNIVSVGTLT